MNATNASLGNITGVFEDNTNASESEAVSSPTVDYPSGQVINQAANAGGFMVSSTDLRHSQLILTHILGIVVCSAGISTNILNIVGYWKIGFKDSTSVSLFALSLFDLGTTILGLLIAICANPEIQTGYAAHAAGAFIVELILSIGGFVKVTLTRISTWITTLVTVERCVCIGAPLKVKAIFSPRKSAAAISVICVCLFVINFPIFLSYKIGYRPIPVGNATSMRLGVTFSKDAPSLRKVSFALNVFIQVLSIAVILFANLSLLIMLQRKNSATRLVTRSHRRVHPAPEIPTISEVPTSLTSVRKYMPKLNLQAQERSTSPQDPCTPITNHIPRPMSTSNVNRSHHRSLTFDYSSKSLAELNTIDASGNDDLPLNVITGTDHLPSTSAETASSKSCPMERQATHMNSVPVTSAPGPTNFFVNVQRERSQRLAKMVGLVSLIQIISLLAPFVLVIVSLVDPQFNMQGTHRNVFRLAYSCATTIENMNASCNIIIYCYLSSRFREIMTTMLRLKRSKKITIRDRGTAEETSMTGTVRPLGLVARGAIIRC